MLLKLPQVFCSYVREEVLMPGFVAAESSTSSLKTGGAILQLDINTRVALTARWGIANTGDGPTTDGVVGLSVY